MTAIEKVLRRRYPYQRLRRRVIANMEKVIFVNGKSESIKTDNGPEFISEKFNIWWQVNGIKHTFIQPGKVMK